MCYYWFPPLHQSLVVPIASGRKECDYFLLRHYRYFGAWVAEPWRYSPDFLVNDALLQWFPFCKPNNTILMSHTQHLRFTSLLLPLRHPLRFRLSFSWERSKLWVWMYDQCLWKQDMKGFHLPDQPVNIYYKISCFPPGTFPGFHTTDRTRHRGDKQKRRYDRLAFIILLSLEYLLSVNQSECHYS